MNYEYKHVKVIEKEGSGKLANYIRFKHKLDAYPGQYVMAWAPGFGEASIPISSYNNLTAELLLTKNSHVQNKLFGVKEKDEILINGPFGHGFPMNNLKQKDIIFIGETSLFAPLWFAYEYISTEREEYKKLSMLVLQTKPKKAYQKRLSEISEKKDEVQITASESDFKTHLDKQKASRNSVYLISMAKPRLKDAVKILVDNGIRKSQIFFYSNRKISCGKGLCGRCMTQGIHICTDGPVFRADRFWRFIEDEPY